MKILAAFVFASTLLMLGSCSSDADGIADTVYKNGRIFIPGDPATVHQGWIP